MNISLALALAITIVSCSTRAPKDPGKASPPKAPKVIGSAHRPGGTSFDARQLANEMESNHVTEIRFKKGSSELSTEARRSLSSVLTEANKEGSAATAKLITWADSEIPTEKKDELSEDQRELARRRNAVLTKFIQNKKRDINIDPLSMAERPSGLKSFIPNETARIQESLKEADIPDKASRSIIIFTRE